MANFFHSRCLELLCLRHALLLTCCLRLQGIPRENHKCKELSTVSHTCKNEQMCMKNEWKWLENASWYGTESQLEQILPNAQAPQGLFVLQPGFIVFDFNLCLAWWKDVESISCCKSMIIYNLSWLSNVQKSLSVFLFTCCFYLSSHSFYSIWLDMSKHWVAPQEVFCPQLNLQSWLSLATVFTVCSWCLEYRQYFRCVQKCLHVRLCPQCICLIDSHNSIVVS